MIDLLKFEHPKQFPKDEIVNEKDRLVRSWMSVEVKDKQGDIVPVSELKRCLNTWFKRGATMMDQHSNRPIGRALRWAEAEHPESKKKGIILDYQVFDDYTVDDKVWDEIKSGKRTGLSIGGRALGKPEMKADSYSGEKGKSLKQIELYETSPVDTPANQLSENLFVNYLAKGMKEDPVTFEKKLMADLKKGYEGDITQPFGGFPDMNSCQESQKQKGHTAESALRICTFLQHRTNQQFLNGTSENQQTAPPPEMQEENSLRDYGQQTEQVQNMEEPDQVPEQVPNQVPGQEMPEPLPEEMMPEDQIQPADEGLPQEETEPEEPLPEEEEPPMPEESMSEEPVPDEEALPEPMPGEEAPEEPSEEPEKKKKPFGKSYEIQKPFAGYTNFADCVSKNQDKGDPKAYCATIMRAVEKAEGVENMWSSEFIKEITKPIQKARVYLKPGQKAPPGAHEQQSENGARFYESTGMGQAQPKVPMRPMQPTQQPHPQTGNLQPNENRLMDAVQGKKPAPDQERYNQGLREASMETNSAFGPLERNRMRQEIRNPQMKPGFGQQKPTGKMPGEPGEFPDMRGNGPEGSKQQGQAPSKQPYEMTNDVEGKQVNVGSTIKIHPQLTSDPKGKQGMTGKIVGIDTNTKDAVVQFDDGTFGIYEEGTFISQEKSGKPFEDSAVKQPHPQTGTEQPNESRLFNQLNRKKSLSKSMDEGLGWPQDFVKTVLAPINL